MDNWLDQSLTLINNEKNKCGGLPSFSCFGLWGAPKLRAGKFENRVPFNH